jgi:ornithine cyclodeaminase/alanine dehydrogenase-like protein (mu-crystallin family)
MIVGRDDIATIIETVGLDPLMDEMIERLTAAISSFDHTRTHVRTRDGFHYDEPGIGLLEWMPVMETGETTTIKVVGYHPSNPTSRNLPTILSTVSVYETASGHLAGLADGTFLTALRTGAASAVASRVLARPDSSVLGLVGCGAQAVTQLHALLRIFPITQVLITDIDQKHIDSFEARTARIRPTSTEIKPVPLDVLIQNADIVSTATSVDIGAGPLFNDLPTKPWLHINAVGSDFPGKVELPASLLRRALVCPDVIEQAVKEGECQVLADEEIGPSLAHVVAHPHAYESWQKDLTVFDSTGWALEDQVAMEMLMGHAQRLGVGSAIALEDIGDDPLDPYRLGRAEFDATVEVATTDPA